ncbi:hypothetical protein GCM10011414_04970 [Croceivirga lutea]|uniref:CheR family methyltransferase n=1 Tax=Croceivirga lutea TaxID=1775167 RepID=UPI00163AABAD|nr:CheR family methyltransferase [Croceivirga lutea]GGG38676.1 hypothetical protein GCM10011414_04970 [Croceivirga lutea]
MGLEYFENSPKNTKEFAKKEIDNPYGFSIVGIGASAGGLQALKDFFDHMPLEPKCSFVIIQHLSPNHKSLMKDILSKNTAIPITEVKKNTNVKPGKIYLVPPNQNIELQSNTLVLSDKPKGQKLNFPIDIFFNSLALNRKEFAVGIVLSGTGSDGTNGAKAIHSYNGMVMVQSPEDAEFSGMVESAIDTGLVDYIFPVKKLPSILMSFIKDPRVKFGIEHEIHRDNLRFNKLLSHLKTLTDFDFTPYKKPTLIRRIARRINFRGFKDFESYFRFLLENKEEVSLLANDFLINVTDFFRDSAVWEHLEKVVIPDLIASKNNGDTLKIWIVACSTGEEAYSYAMLLFEEMVRQDKTNIKLKIFATDIAKNNIEKASLGLFKEKHLINISKHRLQEYFELVEDNQYKIKDFLRHYLIFSQHDIINSSPFANIDMISCRNLLIYIAQETQNRIIKILQYSLNLHGYLVLGKSETLGNLRDSFEDVSNDYKIFRSLKEAKSLYANDISIAKHTFLYQNIAQLEKRNILRKKFDFSMLVEKTLSEELGLACLYLNSNLEIIEAVGNFRTFLQIPETRFSNSLLDLLPEDLKPNLNLALLKVEKSKENVKIESVELTGLEKGTVLDILVVPASKFYGDLEAEFIILFLPKNINPKADIRLKALTKKDKNETVRALEIELENARKSLVALQHEVEIRNEELQTSNEELLATNEELQSTNEELQSVNEELHTVNTELNQKVQDLAHAKATIDNVLKSTDISTLVLSSNLSIKSFTNGIKDFYNITLNDIGRPLLDFTNKYSIDNTFFKSICKTVLETGEVYTEDLEFADNKCMLMRVTPFIQGHKIDGVVLTFVDISAQKTAQLELQQKEYEIRSLFDNAPDMFFAIDANGDIIDANLELIKKLEYNSAEGIIGKNVLDIAQGFTPEELEYDMNLLSQGKDLKDENRTVITKTGKRIPIRVNAKSFLNKDGSIKQVVASWRDVTDLKKAEDFQKVQMKAFEECTDGFYDWDIKNNSIYTSKSIKDWFGYDESEMPDTFESWRKLLVKEDEIIMNALLQNHFDCNGANLYISNERYKHKDGSLVHLQARGKVIEWDENGEPIRMVGSHTNMTKLLKLPVLEQKLVDQNMVFEQVLESTLAGFWDWNIPNNTEYMSPTFKKMFGYEDHEIENTPEWWQKNIHPDDLPGVLDVFEAHVKSKGEVPYDNEVRYYHKNGSIVWVWCKGKVIEWDENNNPIRMVGSHVDITHLKNLTDSNKQLERFAYVASHDLQEPLRTVTDFVGLFKKEYQKKLDEPAIIYLDFIDSAATRMNKLVKGILDYSRIEGKTKQKKVDLNKIVEDVVNDLQIKIDNKGAEIILDKLPLIKGNEVELHSLFLNLIGNALKFVAENDTPEIKISVKRQNNENIIFISDNGIGIKPEHQEKIFDIFSRLHNEDQYEGTGIGLAHCKKIVELHGGRIWVASELGKGSTFYFTLNTK